MRAIVVLFVGILCALCLFHSTKAAPAETAALKVQYKELESAAAGVEAAPELNRQKRATCDLLSGFGVNHSACALHCLLRGKRGGYCDGRGVCNCR
ncbi:phormicin-like [Ceratitis capitata]|uniref:phormicin-like n=1 Tax=Ceratitis capitata TaxID=7213 RepID=UPI0006188D17|nr:phormicin-like [Ceratitis capitata]